MLSFFDNSVPNYNFYKEYHNQNKTNGLFFADKEKQGVFPRPAQLTLSLQQIFTHIRLSNTSRYRLYKHPFLCHHRQ